MSYLLQCEGIKMQKKRKISLTINKDTVPAIENVIKKHNMAKSHIAQKALEPWLVRETETMMAKGYEEMSEEDRIKTERRKCLLRT